MTALPRIAVVALASLLFGCPRGSRGPSTLPASIEVGRPGGTLRGVAGDASTTFVALALPDEPAGASEARPRGLAPPPKPGPRSIVEARRDGRVRWAIELQGSVGPIARTPSLVAVTLTGSDHVEGVAVRGQPALAVVGLDDQVGGPKFFRAFESTEWVIATSIAAAGDDILVGGSFSGTLRAGAMVVSSGGKSDGFVARLSSKGELLWLVRLGGSHADAVQGVAATGDRIAIAGTVGPTADLQGEPLDTGDEKTPYADGFVAELDARGRAKWTATFGSKLDDSVAGVAFDSKGRVAVAANARQVTRIGSAELVAAGPADGFVAYWTPAGTLVTSVLLGGNDFDGLRAIAAVGDRIVVGGFFSGQLQLGTTTLVAGGGDDAFVVALDGDRIVRSWPVSGDGREEVVALAAIPGGFVAGVAYTAKANVDGALLPAPRDPMSGAAVVVRPVE